MPCLQEFDNDSNLSAQLEQKMLKLVNASEPCANPSASSGAALAATYHLGSGGQRVRGRLALSAGLALGLSRSDALCLAATAELLHNASLVHDDLQDRDAVRRSQSAVWSKFGANVAVCTGDLMLSAAYAALCEVTQLHNLAALLAVVHERVAGAITGQCAELCADPDKTASLEEDVAAYQCVAHAKSGALLSLPLELALLASGHGAWAKHAHDAARAFSVGYQVVDDLTDVDRDSLSGALNIIAVLQHSGCGAGAYAQARWLGLAQLDRAITLANELPLESGALLMALSLKLRLSLMVNND